MSWALQGMLPSKEHFPQDTPGRYRKDIFLPALINRPAQVSELRTSNQNTEAGDLLLSISRKTKFRRHCRDEIQHNNFKLKVNNGLNFDFAV